MFHLFHPPSDLPLDIGLYKRGTSQSWAKMSFTICRYVDIWAMEDLGCSGMELSWHWGSSHMRDRWRPACPTIFATGAVFPQLRHRPHTILVWWFRAVSISEGEFWVHTSPWQGGRPVWCLPVNGGSHHRWRGQRSLCRCLSTLKLGEDKASGFSVEAVECICGVNQHNGFRFVIIKGLFHCVDCCFTPRLLAGE